MDESTAHVVRRSLKGPTGMDLEDRLKRLKRERAARPRRDSVNHAWQEIDREAGLTTKEKLERLINLTGAGKKDHRRPRVPEPLSGRPFQIFENHFNLHTRYGRIPLSAGLKIDGRILSLFSRNSGFEERDLSTGLFLDLETTGLSGGVGVVPFLVGLGFYRDGQFHVIQFFLGDLSDEESLIRELARFFSQMDFQSVVSFNGKAFDLPLLETRFILHRESLTLSELPHLDFLFSARSLWGHKYESCRLYHLAREILDAERGDDIPSAEIPVRYFQYLRSGDFSLIEPILYHNQEDLLSLLGVVISGARLFQEEPTENLEVTADAMDLYGAARLLERTGEVERSASFMIKALEGRLSEEVTVMAKMKLASHFKKKQEWDKAISLWQEMTPLNQLSCFRELAMYFEHKEKNYDKARAVAEEGLSLALGVSKTYEEDFSHRLARLREKDGQTKRGKKDRKLRGAT
jgi:hypothetical protein